MKTLQAILTDGADVFEVRQIDRHEFDSEMSRLNTEAKTATDGNLYWIEDKRGYTYSH
ncbi:MAG TPA: hypothetical protein VJ742_00665 [Nitrososphaera sp.]|nr:hypothetical protein [Nitrososphaera sp.]